jgi:hypothetical protein
VRRVAVAVLLAVAACGCGCGSGRSGPPSAPPWRLELPGWRPLSMALVPDGRIVSAWAILGPATIGARTITPRGHGDLVFVVQAADGAVAAVFPLDLDDPGIINATDLVVDGDRVRAGVLTDAGFAVAETTIAATPQPPDQVRPEMSFSVVTLDLAAGPTGVIAVHAGVPNGNNRVALAGDGDLLVSGEIFSRTTDTVTVLQRVSPTGEVRWERRFEINDIGPLVAAPDGAIAFGGDSTDWLAVVALDRDGAERWRCRIDGAGSSITDFVLGHFGALRLDGDGIHAVGEITGTYRLGDEPVRRGQDRLVYALDCLDGGRARFRPLTVPARRAELLGGGEVVHDDVIPGKELVVHALDVAGGDHRRLAVAGIFPEDALVTPDGGAILLGYTSDRDRDSPGVIARVVPR